MKKNNLMRKELRAKCIKSIPLQFIFLFSVFLFPGCEKQFGNEGPVETNNVPLMLKQASVSNSIKVMSFNIRHDDSSDPQSLAERKNSILQVILEQDPEIVGVQEFSNNWFETWLIDTLDAVGYDVFTSPVGDQSAVWGTPKAIFYKNNRFTMIDGDYFTMVYNENRCGRWAILEDDATNEQYFVCNNHWSTYSSAERVNNANDVVDVIEDNYGGLPQIIFGDLNAEPGTSEIDVIKSATSGLVSTHSDSGNTFHGWDATGDKKIDWMLCSRDLSFINYKVVENSYSGYWPSDHWPITTTFIPAIFGGTHYDINGISAVSSTQFYFADVTGDGKEDKIFWRPTFDSGRPRIYSSDGDGTFTFKLAHTASASTLSTTKYYFADIDGDGMDDLIKWDYTQNSGHTLVYFAEGNGDFSNTPVSDDSGTSQSSNTTFYFADVDGDGDADKIYWNPTFDSGHTRVWLSDGDGNFTFANSNTNGTSESTSTAFYFADVNGDAKADKIYWNPTYDIGPTRVWLSNGDGTFTWAESNTNGYSISTSTTFYFADINGDGKDDKIYWNPNNFQGKLKVYMSKGDGSFDDPIYTLRGTSESSDTQYFFADLDGDGQNDQIRWNYGQSPEGYSQGTLKNYFAK